MVTPQKNSMPQLVLANRHAPLNRTLYSLACDEITKIPDSIRLPDMHLALFLAWDARGTATREIDDLASALLAKGLAFICTWGPDCERVHDIFDETEIGEGWQLAPDSVVMSTWHSGESLEKALWFFVNSSYPDAAYASTCTAGVAAAVNNRSWARQISAWLSDLPSLNRAIGI